MADQEIALATQETGAAADNAVVAAATETQLETTPKKYDFGKFEKAIDEGKLTTDLLEDVFTHGPAWEGHYQKRVKQAADEKNKAAALRTEYETKLKAGNVQETKRIEKPEDHPAVIAMTKTIAKLKKTGRVTDEDATAIMDDVLGQAQEDINRQDYIRKDDLERLLAAKTSEQQETVQLQTGATELMTKYKDLVNPEQAVALIAAFAENDDPPMLAMRKAVAFIEAVKESALKQEKPKPKSTIIKPGATPAFGARPLSDEDKELSEMQAKFTAQEVT